MTTVFLWHWLFVLFLARSLSTSLAPSSLPFLSLPPSLLFPFCSSAKLSIAAILQMVKVWFDDDAAPTRCAQFLCVCVFVVCVCLLCVCVCCVCVVCVFAMLLKTSYRGTSHRFLLLYVRVL